MDNLLLPVSLMCLFVLLLIFVLKKINQPYLIAYILAGVLMGPHVAGIFTNVEYTAGVGEVGILLLMFFLGMEIDIPDNRTLLFKPVVAQGMKILLSVGFVALLSILTKWSTVHVILIAVLFIFNSTAVVSEYLRKHGELKTDFGKTILNILLLQDVLLAPVLTMLQIMAGGHFSLRCIKHLTMIMNYRYLPLARCA